MRLTPLGKCNVREGEVREEAESTPQRVSLGTEWPTESVPQNPYIPTWRNGRNTHANTGNIHCSPKHNTN